MSSLLQIAAEFIDRMTNPVYGAQINDEYAQRFAALLDDDFEQSLRREVKTLDSTSALTPHGWTWLLDWARTNDTSIDDQVLLRLCEEWESTAFKAAAIESAVGGREVQADIVGGVGEFPDLWLRQLLSNAIASPAGYDRDSFVDRPVTFPRHSRHVQSLLLALLLVDEDITIQAAAVLLHEPWRGHDALLEYFWSRFDALDEETQSIWARRLEPPPRPNS